MSLDHLVPTTTREYGNRCLHEVFDEITATSPHRLYTSIPFATDLTKGFKDLSFEYISHCVDAFANHLEETVGRSTKTGTIAYLGVPDVRNAIVFLAAVKCGYKLLFLSPRNQSSTTISLMRQTDCDTLIHSGEMTPLVKTLKADYPCLKNIPVAELEKLELQKIEPFQWDRTSEDIMRKPILILHSSGSTGTPKPITMTHGTFSTFDYCRKLPVVPGRRNNDFTMWDSTTPRRFYSAFPPSHLAGFLSMIIVPIFSEGSSPVLGPPSRPPSGQLVKDIMERQNLKSLFIPPAVAEQILQEPTGLEFFRGLDFIYTAGGPLSQSAGDLISSVTPVCQLYGSTETSQIPMLVPLPEDWAYMEFHPSLKYEMRPTGSEDGACELVLYVDAATEKIAALNYNLPGISKFPTRDLFTPHSSKPGLWRFHGRIDDVIVLSNSEKFFPVPMEIKLSGHPSLLGALVFGQGRFQAGLLLEPKGVVTDLDAFVDEVWPFVEEANSLVPGQGRITRSKILVTTCNKPFQRAPKGTIVRSLTLKDYQHEIESLYAESGPAYSAKSVPTLKPTFQVAAIEQWIRSVVLQAFPVMEKASDTDDMFVLGLDSLKTYDILGMLKASLGRHKDTSELDWLSSATIYSNPTIKQLAAIVAHFLGSDDSDGSTLDVENQGHRGEQIERLIRENTNDLTSEQPIAAQTSSHSGYIVAVTGTTGSLGKMVVQQLSRSSSITKIYCLNRSQNGRVSREPLGEAQLEDISINLSEPNFGLTQDLHSRLAYEVDIIIHNAWKVDFSHTLQSYSSNHLRGVRTLIDWSINSPKRPRIIFISSISSVSNFLGQTPESPIPETLITSNDAPAHMGYAESKYVAERILGAAKVPVSILRVGQIAGSTEPEDPPWPIQEWFPSLIITSKALRSLPNELPPIDWIPIDGLASIITELTLHDFKSSNNLEVYNLVNPNPRPWQKFKDLVNAHCGPKSQLIPLETWVQRLKSLPRDKQEVESKPALKMLEFFEQMGQSSVPNRYETKSGVSASKTMASLRPVNREWMEIWLEQWGF